MIRWRTLNKGDEVEQLDNTEIQTEHLLENYQNALNLHQKGLLADAKTMYELILSNDVMTAEDNEELTKGSALHSSSLVMLRFLVFKNYAATVEEESTGASLSKIDRESLLQKAMDYYIKALMVDPTDRSIWYRIGVLAVSLHNLCLARASFEQGLYLDTSKLQHQQQQQQQQQQPTAPMPNVISILTGNRSHRPDAFNLFKCGSLSPTQWQCLEGLCGILYSIGDYDLCGTYLKLGLQRFSGWTFAKDLDAKMATNSDVDIDSNSNNTFDTIPSPRDKDMDSQHSQPITLAIESPSWNNILSALLDQYKQIHLEKKAKVARGQYSNQVEDSGDGLLYINRVVRIDIESTENTSAEIHRDTVMSDAGDSTALDTTQDAPPTPDDQGVDHKTAQQIDSDQHITISSSTALIKVDKRGGLEHFYESTDTPADSTIGVTLADSLDTTHHSQNGSSLQGATERCMIDLTEDDQDDTSESLKRKRNDDQGQNNDDKEDDDEQEHEDKRISLRASKRQKEKVESEEVFKKKMLEEEDALNKMAQDVFDTFENFDDLRRGTPWYTPMDPGMDENTLEFFWEFFDLKVSELNIHFTWNFDLLKAKDTFSVVPSKKYLFAKFESSDCPHPSSTLTRETATAVRHFIQLLNETNSGTTDSLCQTIVAILRLATQPSTDIADDRLVDLLLDAAETLGQELLNTIIRTSLQDLWTHSDNYEQQIQMLLCLCEKLVDRLIDSIRTDQTTMNGPSLSSKQRLLIDKQRKLIKRYREHCNMWVNLVGQGLVQGSVNAFGPSSLTDHMDGAVDQTNSKRMILLRYWLLKGKLAQCENDVDVAVGWYKKCERLLGNTENGELDSTLPCRYDSTVDLSAVQHKLSLMERDKYIAAAQLKLADDDYDGALTQLETLKSGQASYGQVTDSSDGFSITIMLAKCYMKTERYADAWKCYVDILTTLVPQLVAYGGQCMKSNSIVTKGDDVEFLRLLCSLDTAVDALTHLLLYTNHEDWLPPSLSSRFVDSLMIVLRTTVIYTFRHPDFIPLVNNFSNPDVKPHVPSRRTKTNSYNAVTTKMWVMVSTLAQRNIKKDSDGSKMLSLANLLQNMHDELGEREICGASKGIFLQHLIKVLSDVDVKSGRRGIYQCYHCLYGVHLAGEAELIEEHHANHGDVTEEAAEHLYKLVIGDVLQKMDRNLPLKTDLKDAIETASGLFEELPNDNPHVERNRDIITNYLNRPVNVNLPIKSMLQQCGLPIDGAHGNIPSLSVVFEHIFLIRGKTLRMHIKNKPKVSSDRTMADLEEAVEQFKCHVILHPNDLQGWYELGSTLMQLAEEELTWSAVNIVTHKNLIAEYQKEAFRAFMKTWQLATTGRGLKKNQLFGFFSSFGSLIYSMTCEPMNMASFECDRPMRTLDKSGGLHSKIPKKPDSGSAYRLALTLFFRALQYNSHDRSEWSTLRAIGKCASNLKRPPKEVLDWYVKSIRQYRDTGTSGTVALEAFYKLYATLLKYLYRGVIEPSDVFDYVKLVSTMHNTDSLMGSAPPPPPPPPSLSLTATNPVYLIGNAPTSMTGIMDLTMSDANLPIQPAPQVSSRMEAYGLLFDKLTELRKGDKKHWYHRPVYRIAWMYHKIYNDAYKAKAELLPLFTLKQPNKGLMNIWRSEFERPGKHFVFNRQYVNFLIELAKETNDLDTLKNLCRKLKKASTTLLKEDEGFKEALLAYIEVLQEETLNPLQGSAKRQQLITGPVNEDGFDTLCKDLTKDMTSSTGTTHYIIPILQDLIDIRRQAVGYVSTDALDTTIQECFVVLLFEQTQIQLLLPQESPIPSTMAISSLSPSQPQEEHNHRSENLDVGSTFMQHSDDNAIKSKDVDATDATEKQQQHHGIQGKLLLQRALSLAASLSGNVRTQ